MSSAFRTRQPHEALPPEIYIPLVELAFQGGPHPLRRNNCRCGGGFHYLLEDRRDPSFLLRDSRHLGRLCARIDDARVFPRAVDDHHGGRGAAMGTSLRRGSGGVRRVARRLVLHLVHSYRRPVCRSCQFYHDNDLRGGHLRAEFRQRTLRRRASPVCVAADDGCADILRKFVSLDFCRASCPVLSWDEVHGGATASHSARCGDHVTRHVAIGKAVRHRA